MGDIDWWGIDKSKYEDTDDEEDEEEPEEAETEAED
jgi:hypothetical protein